MALVTTTKGDMDDAFLEKREGQSENEDEIVKWVEYWLNGELVHRSVHVHLKKALVIGASTAVFE